MSMSSRIKIDVKNLSKSFGSKQILQNINFTVRAHESLVIIGGSGSGKSVLLKCITGLLFPDAGSKVLIDSEDCTFLHIVKRKKFTCKFGMLFQGGALFDSLPIWHNIMFSALQNGFINKKQACEIAVQKLEMVGLNAEVINLLPAEMSGGMQKRIALARAIANDPEIIFFDEPTAGLDPIMSKLISYLITDLSKKLNATTITITHDMNCMKQVADQVVMIREGKVDWKGSVNEIALSNNSYLHEFVGI